MFYYLLYNSSFLKKKNSKERGLYTLIYGSIVYIIMHAILSFSFKSDIVRYFWFIFLIDCSAMFISSDFEGFSSLNVMKYNKEEPNLIRDQIIDNYIINNSGNTIEDENVENSDKNSVTKSEKNKPDVEKHIVNKKNKNKNKKKSPKNVETPKKKESKKKLKKQVSFHDSTPISILKKNETLDEYGEEEADSINLTLENLENLELDVETESKTGSQSISDLQNNFLKKKMEDEYSDPGSGSDIDLDGFEESLISE